MHWESYHNMVELDPSEVLYLKKKMINWKTTSGWAGIVCHWFLSIVVIRVCVTMAWWAVCVHALGNTDANTPMAVITATLETNAEVV